MNFVAFDVAVLSVKPRLGYAAAANRSDAIKRQSLWDDGTYVPGTPALQSPWARDSLHDNFMFAVWC